jgi:hypothetical protein
MRCVLQSTLKRLETLEREKGLADYMGPPSGVLALPMEGY